MTRSAYQISVYSAGLGHAYEIRDQLSRVVRSGWGIGNQQSVYADARRVVQQLELADERHTTSETT